MSDFKAKMHQIVCRLGLRPRLRWPTALPRPLAKFYGAYFEGKGRDEREREGREGRKGEEGERGGRDGVGDRGGERAGSAPS